MRVGGYQLLTRLGEGGMGVVHLARGPSGERVALKVIRPNVVGDDESRARLAREVNSLSRVRSRRVAEIIDADPWGPVPFVATRYVPGLSLHDHVAEEGPLDDDDLVWFARCLGEALATVHAAGVLHRDVKPSNVLMEGRSPVLIDFGLARVADDPRLTAQGWLVGTPGYLAPEILHGEDATTAADVHSWAATVAFAGTGRAPFGTGPSVAVMDRVRRGEHDLSGLPEEVREVVEAALDPSPRHRPTLAAVQNWLDFDDAPLTVVRAGDRADAEPTVHLPWQPVPETRPYGDSFDEAYEDSHHYPEDAFEEPELSPTRRIRVAGPDDGYDDFPDDDAELLDDELDDELDGEWGEPVPPAVRVGLAERFRRSTVHLSLVGVVAGATMHAPYVVLVVLLAGAWLLRSGSLAGSATQERRRERGRKWYDGPWTLLSTPYHVLVAVPGTLALTIWAAGFGLAVGLLCFAFAVSVPVSLALVGAGAACGFWAGPGAGRVRGAVRRVTVPVAARGWVWLFGTVALAVLAGALVVSGLQVDADLTPF